MRTLFLSLFVALLFSFPANSQSLQSPAEFLGYELGSQFTPHHNVLAYFRHMAEQTDQVSLTQYGTTYEGRELVFATISSPENAGRMEQIRMSNLGRTGLAPSDAILQDQPAVVWLSYNVHGNETVSSESAMMTLYALVSGENSAAATWLEEVVVIMDPMLNPDGRDRYVQWYRSVRGAQPNANVESREHQEPWPGGRTNHYYFDLNRDWAWQTQKESKQRIKVYNQWMPQVHVDFHEQGKDDHYYFAPAAQPFHKAITTWQSEFQNRIGKNHARYFNEEYWLYFTREVFDLFYPSYGDTWPTFNGSVGMTYEQAGHSLGGLAVETNDGDTLTLAERIIHHHTTGLSTVEATAKNREKALSEFTDYFRSVREGGSGTYKSFVIKSGQQPDKLAQLLSYLDDQQITYQQPQRGKRMEGYDYATGQNRRVEVEESDILITTNQPKGVLARVLFEPEPELVDSLTYDITAWALPYAYGLEAYAFKDLISGESFTASEPVNKQMGQLEKPYAYISRWESLDDVRFLGDLLEAGIGVRTAERPFTLGGNTYAEGTLIITRTANERLGERFDTIVQELANKHQRALYRSATGFVNTGSDFGSDAVHYLEKPRVALLAGEATSSNQTGEIWHFFDQQIDYPLHIIDTDDIGSTTWEEYDVLIMPSGRYGSLFGSDEQEALNEWITAGGKLIAVQYANNFLAGQSGFGLKRKESTMEDEEAVKDPQPGYSGRNRRAISGYNPGSVFEISLDATHPLGFGYSDAYYTLKLDANAFAYLESGWNVGILKQGAHRSGFVGHQAKKQLEETLTFGVEQKGGGTVIYMVDNPLFRGFWESGKLLFANAVFMVGQ